MIIQITPSYKPAFIYGGPTISISSLCEELVRAKMELIVLTTTANGKSELEMRLDDMVDGVNVSYFKRDIRVQIHLSIHLLRHLYILLKSKQAVVHIHSWWNATSILSCIIAKHLKRKVILSPRGMLTAYSFKNRHRLLKWSVHHLIGNRLIKYCQIHATTDIEMMDILKMIDHKNVVVIPNYINIPANIDSEPTKNKKVKNCFRLLFLSRVEEKKGLDLTFFALSKLDFPWRLTIAGSGTKKYVNQLKKQAKACGIDQHINWIGFVDESRKAALFDEHDLLVLFSQNENFANVIIESLYYGLPVATSFHVGLSEFIQANNLGWVTELDHSSIANTLKNAWTDGNRRAIISSKARSIVNSYFNLNQVIPKYITLYQTP